MRDYVRRSIHTEKGNMSESIKERDKRLERATRQMIESAKQSAQLYLGTPGSQSRGRKPRKSGLKKSASGETVKGKGVPPRQS